MRVATQESQGGMKFKDNDLKIKIQDHRRTNNESKEFSRTRLQVSRKEYPSLIDTFFVAHTVNAVFTRDEDRIIYKEMRRLEATGTYTDDEINRLARRGKQRGHILGVGRVLPARVTACPSRPTPESTLKSLHKKMDFMMRLFKSDSKYSDAFSQFESAGASGSGGSSGCGDDEESADDQEDEDEDEDGDGDS
nr:F-box domain, leucine-rich repeat domain, L domain-like protein [Tanacetum cinerariifolium]